jgi:hypothetical protein
MRETNDLQRLLRRWTSLGPYNSIHLMRLAGTPETARWLAAIAPRLADLGVKASAELPVAAHGLEQAVTAELNTGFGPGDPPLRFFLVPEAASYYLGVTFDHWISDSPSVRALMERTLAAYENPGNPPAFPAQQVCEKPFDELYGRSGFISNLAATAKVYLRHRRVYRLPLQQPVDFTSGFRCVRLPDGLIDGIRAFAKRNGASVNDVFLAAAAQALGAHTAPARAQVRSRPFRAKRDRLALAVAVDVRPLAKEPLDHQFGFFLGFYSVFLEAPETRPLPELTSQIATLTKVMKDGRAAVQQMRSASIVLRLWDFYQNPRQRSLVMHRGTPHTATISNVNLTNSWAGKEGRVLDYLRVSPAGPVAPIVFTPTTIREKLSVCVTHRTTAFTDEAAAGITADFIARLQGV